MIACIFYDSDGIRSFEPFSRLLFNLFFTGYFLTGTLACFLPVISRLLFNRLFTGYFLTGSSSGSSVRFFTALQLL